MTDLPRIPYGTSYQTIMDSYFGNMSLEAQDVLWHNFLTQQGLTTNPTTQESSVLLPKFTEYVNDIYDTLNYPEAVSEGTKTRIIWSIFDILILMMQKCMKTQITDQDAVRFLAEYQKNYQSLMSKGFFYMSSTPTSDTTKPGQWWSTTNPPTPTKDPTTNQYDISKFQLGYGQLTVADYANWLYQVTSSTTTVSPDTGLTTPVPVNTPVTLRLYSQPEDLYSRLYVMGIPCLPFKSGTASRYIDMTATRDANNNFTIQITTHIEHRVNDIDNWAFAYQRNDYVTTHSTVSTAAGTATSEGAFNALFQTAFTQAYDDAKNDLPSLSLQVPWGTTTTSSGTANILWNYSGSDQETQSFSATLGKLRAEKNRSMQVLLDALKSKKEAIGDRTTQQQRIIDAASAGRRQTASMIDALISQMKNILSGIYK